MFANLDTKTVYARIRPAFGDGTSSLIGLSGLRSVLRLGSNLILTRLLAPEAFGVMAILMSVMYILTMLTDLGFKAYVTRHENANDELLKTVWTVRFLRNILLSSVMLLGAGAFAHLYANPEVAPAIMVMAAIFSIESVASLAFETGQRERRVLRISFVEFGKFLITSIVTLIAAVFLRNYWAVVVGMFAGSFYLVFASYVLIPSRPVGFRLNRDDLVDLWRFSKYVIPSSMITIVLMQADKILVANLFPLAELGKYMLAVTITQAVTVVIVSYTNRVFFPLMAQTEREDPASAGRVFYDSRLRLTLFLAFAIGGLIGGGPLAAQILFNDNYLGTGLYLSILAVGCLSALIARPALSGLVAKGYIRTNLIVSILKLIWLMVAVPAAYHFWGAIGIIIAFALAEAAILPYLWRRQMQYGLFDFRFEALIFAAAGAGALIGYAAYRAAGALIALGVLPQF